MQQIILAYDTRQRLSKAASAFVDAAKRWFTTHDIFAL